MNKLKDIVFDESWIDSDFKRVYFLKSPFYDMRLDIKHTRNLNEHTTSKCNTYFNDIQSYMHKSLVRVDGLLSTRYIDGKTLQDLYTVDDMMNKVMYDEKTKNTQYKSAAYFDVDTCLFLTVEKDNDEIIVDSILYSPLYEYDITQIKNFINDKTYTKPDSSEIAVIVKSYGELTLHYAELEPKPVDIIKHYTKSFEPSHNKIIECLNKGKEGIILLHGVPGSGKTNYIKYITSHVKKRFIYLPASMIDILTTPEGLSFLLMYPDSILVIEDCEKYIQQRVGSTGSNSVSTLLNMSNGILSDIANIQLICTFNSELSDIDTALTRDERLLVEYNFTNLSKEHINDNFNITVDVDMSLAEVYAQLKDTKAITSPVKEKRFGFV